MEGGVVVEVGVVVVVFFATGLDVLPEVLEGVIEVFEDVRVLRSPF